MLQPSDNLWFKAYTVAGPNHTPTPLSENLFVELVNTYGQVLKRNTIFLNKGLGQGDFHLNDTLAAGDYTIRAYTNWMRNFDEEFIFSKNIKLVDDQLPENKNLPQLTYRPSIEFFPEGGDLIANIESRVAFEISNSNSNSSKGKIFDQNDSLISSFQTSHQDMGAFKFTPKSGEKYYAILSDQSEKFELPVIKSSGFGLMITQDDDDIIVKVTPPLIAGSENHSAYLVAHTRGIIGACGPGSRGLTGANQRAVHIA